MSKPNRRPTREARKEQKQKRLKRNGSCVLRKLKGAWWCRALRAS
jgi:hypothetical protein